VASRRPRRCDHRREGPDRKRAALANGFQSVPKSRIVTGISPQKHADYPFSTLDKDPYTRGYSNDKARRSRDDPALLMHSGTVRASENESNEWLAPGEEPGGSECSAINAGRHTLRGTTGRREGKWHDRQRPDSPRRRAR
jgi:hypothetical protein